MLEIGSREYWCALKLSSTCRCMFNGPIYMMFLHELRNRDGPTKNIPKRKKAHNMQEIQILHLNILLLHT